MIREELLKLPKVELHVHLEGSIQPETVLLLAERNRVDLPASDVQGLRDWYTFRDFPHFVEIYTTISSCIRTPEDIEFITREFLCGQASQNIIYTEATFTAFTLFTQSGIPWDEQLDAINRARIWARHEYNIEMQLVIDIVRERLVAEGESIAQWVIDSFGKGVCALGLTGIEGLNPPKKHKNAFVQVAKAGIPLTTHAGETEGPWSIWGCLNDLGSHRIGHGVRCLEDPALVDHLIENRIHLEVCPSSNVCLDVFPTLTDHTLPSLIDRGISVSINSDDPPMFNTSLTDEYVCCAEAFGLTSNQIQSIIQSAAGVAFLSESDKSSLIERLRPIESVATDR